MKKNSDFFTTVVAILAWVFVGAGQGDDVISLGAMIPEGFASRNVVIPSFKEGKLASKLTAETVVRIDETRLDADKVVVEIQGEKPEEEIVVVMPGAVYDMQDKVMRSGGRSQISRADFEMEGDTLVFDLNSSIGAMKGRVRTLIFDIESLKRQSSQSNVGSDL